MSTQNTYGPKIINWVEMPGLLGEDEHIEFLKRDILIKKTSGKLDELKNISKNNDGEYAFFYNLDRIMTINNIHHNDFKDFAKELIDTVKSNGDTKSVVHTNIINPYISNLFRREGIPYLEKNLEDRMTAFNITLNLIKPLFMHNNSMIRSYIRIDTSSMKYKAEIRRLDNYKIYANGIIKDISMNGFCLVLGDKNHLNYFSLKDTVSMKLSIGHYMIKLNLALVTRIDGEKNQIAVNFNINDSKMIGVLDADYLTKIILKSLKDTYINK